MKLKISVKDALLGVSLVLCVLVIHLHHQSERGIELLFSKHGLSITSLLGESYDGVHLIELKV